MLAFFLAPVYIALNAYIVRWMILWMSDMHDLFRRKWTRVLLIAVYTFFALTPLTSFLFKEGDLHRILKVINNFWLGMLLYIILGILVMDAIRIVLKFTKHRDKKWFRSSKVFVVNGWICAIFVVTFSLYGFFHAYQIQDQSYEIEVEKSVEGKDELTIALVADMHLGYSCGARQMEIMAEKINAMHPDLVCFAGDIYDNDFDALDDPERISKAFCSIKSTYGTYACWGNHDFKEEILAGFTFDSADKEPDLRMEEFLRESNIILLEDESVLIDDQFYLVGRLDPAYAKNENEVRMSSEEILSGIDKDKLVIVMDHEPKELHELAANGTDIDLGGHTHDGQMFPGNLVMKFLWENPTGCEKIDGMYSVVTSGVGVWGPAMRVGTNSEVVEVEVALER